MDKRIHVNDTTRKFLCLDSFSSEGRKCYKDEIYVAYPVEGGYKLVFENGDMNFTEELFERVVEAWAGVLLEITG
ncbi:hypothetical protein [Enterococcus sp. N249-2]